MRRLEDALNYLGQPLPPETHAALNEAMALSNETAAVRRIQELLDPLVLAEIEINAESRVKVTQGVAKPELVEGGTRLFLVKVNNLAGVTAPLVVESPNSGPVYLQSHGEHAPKMELTMTDVKERWGSFAIFTKPPMRERLTGLGVEYVVLEAYSRDVGQRSALLAFNVGQGTQDIGFRNDIMVVFTAAPARDITLRVKNENGERAMASFVVRDRQGRLYPNPAKRLEPDFPFQPQVYRYDGERFRLPDGYYTIEYSGGPEYYTRTKELPVSAQGPRELEFQLQRWIDPSKYGWWSGDHHVHASGCAHYKNPTEGVEPEAMMRQALGENLNISSVLTWGPSWYHQKQYFSGTDNELSKTNRLMHYDVEVSGFPSAHAGHLILLGLSEDDYPGTTKIEEWPTWDLPVLKWGKSQDAITGFSHSGWGLEVRTDELPNYEMPGFDGIGANEYVVDVTHPDTIDFISTVDTPAVWELNVWYHTLNVGFRTRISGETDFPCIYQEKVGLGRSYVQLDDLSYRGWIEGVRRGAAYVSDGKSHLIDFKVNGEGIGERDSTLKLQGPGKAKVTMKVAAMLPERANPKFATLRYDQKPYWDVERARVEGEREIPVEIVVNGKPVAVKNVVADGQVRDVEFEVPIERSSWVAARVLYSSHTNPMFVEVADKPIRASRRSAEWLLDAVNQCWTQKAPRIRESEIEDARKAYDHARQVYKQRIAESEVYE
ncbi:MAG: CehA/McbA family metallohydrolase [Bryobacterales bacterium]|nr:CehA/McbA family metallohydrolase [Acidobacteriota bacterium]MCB9382995.1 CehA/McbA family metallohydrolase [Bryobacterales bacterium]